MPARRTFLIALSGAVSGVAGCIDSGTPENNSGDGRSDDEGEQNGDGTEPGERTDEPSYYFTAAPATAADDLDPVLFTEEPAIAEIEPLLYVIEEAIDSLSVSRRTISPEDAEAFESVTADVEYYFSGNPPGYYIGHEGRRVSVTLNGG